MAWRLLVLAVLFASAGPATAHAAGAGPARHFDCDDGFHFSVTFRNGAAELALPYWSVVLPRTPAVAGARYSDGRITYYEHEGGAWLDLPDRAYHDCRPRKRT